MTFLIADGVVPSNEDRGYVLRRIMRRAILQGRHTLELDPGFLDRYAEVVTELMGAEYRELTEHRDTVRKWLQAEEEGFGRTLVQGSKLLDELITRAKESGAEGIGGADAFQLHDTYGFPIDLTLELVAEHGLGVDEQGFEAADGRSAHTGARGRRTRAGRTRSCASRRRRSPVRPASPPSSSATRRPSARPRWGGGLRQRTSAGQARRVAVLCHRRWADRRFRCRRVLRGDCVATVEDVVRLGDDQVIALDPERGTIEPGTRVRARVDRRARHATEANHTGTHLLHAALRRRLGEHVHQAGSYVGPDKLRFDFTHGSGLAAEELADIENDVNGWILASHPVRALTTTLDEARRLGAMALFGEKYGDIVRMVEVGDGSFSRELCGGTHVRSTSEIGLFKLLSESSSAANVRRIEAVTGPAAVELVRAHDRALTEAGRTLRVPPERVPDEVTTLRTQIRDLERAARRGPTGNGAVDVEQLLAAATEIDGAHVLVASLESIDGKALLDVADRLRAKLGDAAIVLGSASEDKVDLVATVSPSLVERGVRAGEIVKLAAAEVGGGGGGRDTLARAGGRDPEKLPEAITAARRAIEAALTR